MKLLAAAGTRQFTARPASIGCLACHGQYFAASLPIHQKSCFQRNAFELIPCEKCRTCIRWVALELCNASQLDSHAVDRAAERATSLSTPPPAPASQGRSTMRHGLVALTSTARWLKE